MKEMRKIRMKERNDEKDGGKVERMEEEENGGKKGGIEGRKGRDDERTRTSNEGEKERKGGKS